MKSLLVGLLAAAAALAAVAVAGSAGATPADKGAAVVHGAGGARAAG